MLSSRLVVSAAMVGVVTACSGSTSPNGGTALSLSLASRSLGGAQATAAGEGFTLGSTSIDFTSVQIVLKSIKLVRASHEDCEVGDDQPSDDACEAVKIGPQLFAVPLDAGAQRVLTVDVDAGTYRRLKFHVHKPEDDGNQIDAGFLANHPEFKKISIRIEGAFNDTPFTFETDLNAVQQITFDTPLIVGTTGPVDVTMFLDLATWFQNGQATEFVDPATALKGGSNHNLVEQNIKRSIRVFRDSDHDGDDDDHEGES